MSKLNTRSSILSSNLLLKKYSIENLLKTTKPLKLFTDSDYFDISIARFNATKKQERDTKVLIIRKIFYKNKTLFKICCKLPSH